MASNDRSDMRSAPLTRDDDPPHSRLFVLAGKGAKREAFLETFGKFGRVDDVYQLRDKSVAYVKFSKFSEAALAMEELNGTRLPGQPKNMKVMIASNRKEGSVRDDREDEKYIRLFVIVPKTMKDEEFKEEFLQYGDIEHCNILKDKESGKSKGFGYVKYKRAYHAALALEECDPAFKAKLADPKHNNKGKQNMDRRMDMDRRQDMDFGYDRGDKRGFRDAMWPDTDNYGYHHESRSSRYDPVPQMPMRMSQAAGMGLMGQMPNAMPQMPQMPSLMAEMAANMNSMKSPMTGMTGPMDILTQYPHTGEQRLHITCSVGLNQKCLTRLLNFIPGLDYCDFNESTGVAYARYTTPQCAAYALDKLDGFEYPIGCKLYCRYAEQASEMDSYGNSRGDSSADMYSKAASVLEQAGINPNLILGGADTITERVRYCNADLPRPKPLMPVNSEVVRRLFIVTQPERVPDSILRDAFCRFGNLMDVNLLPGKNFGYARYTNNESANLAMSTLHGIMIAGQRMKVLEANPRRNDMEPRDRDDNDWPSKKQRI